jgi:hypothetical protein
MQIDPEFVIAQLLEDVKRLTFENAALRAMIENPPQETAEADGES